MMKEKVELQIDADAEAAKATGKRLERQTLRVHNALTRMKLRTVEKRCVMLSTALTNISMGELPVGHGPEKGTLPPEQAMVGALQSYADWIVENDCPDRLAVVGYAKDSKVYCMDCSKHQKGSMEPVYSGVDFIACAGCAAGLFVE